MDHSFCLHPDKCSCMCQTCQNAWKNEGYPTCRDSGGRWSHDECHGTSSKCYECNGSGIVAGPGGTEFCSRCGGLGRVIVHAAPAPTPAPAPAPAEARKYDQGKPPLSRLFVLGEALEGVAFALGYGRGKYGDDVNWQKVENGEERYLNAAVRHISKHVSGRLLDSEPDEQGRPGSGLPHLWHAACSLLMSLWHASTRLDKVRREGSRVDRDG